MGWLAAALAAAAGVGGGLWWWLLRLPLPRVRGTVRAPGLGAPVEIARDGWGIPHIAAQSEGDAAFGLGYAHAQDRLWQMELHRRIGTGRLAELFGPVALEADRFVRRLGLHRAAAAEADALGEEERGWLEAYARGVNAAVAALGRRLPLEFRLLGLRPEPWRPVDSIAWAKVMCLTLGHNFQDELVRYRLLQQAGPAVAARLETHYPPGLPLTTAPGGPGALDSADALLQGLAALQPYLLTDHPGASNNWVVAGSRTATGKPLLANDPHLTLQVPSLWYEAHLMYPGTSVTGATLPGAPGVIIGHNEHVGWGFTDAMADVQDLYLERWRPGTAEYEYAGQWEPATVVEETIRVKGQAAVTETVHITRHGPVLAGGPLGPGPALALRWTALAPGTLMRAVLAMNRARSVAEFRAAMRHWSAPVQNAVCADVDGNIGYIMTGQVPIRKNGSGVAPVPGWSGEYEWVGWVPFDDLPQVWNPPCGYIVTANNKTVDHTYPYHIAWDYMPGYRAQRIQEVLAARPQLTVRDCRDLQMDVLSLPGREFAALCRGLAPADPLERHALAALLAWDGQLTPESVGGAVYQVMLHHALHRAYGQVLDPDLLAAWLGKGHPLAPANSRVGRAATVLLRELHRRDAPPPGARLAAAGPGDPWDSLLAASLADAVAYLRRTLGPDPARWQWGRLHRLKLAHPLAAVKPLHRIFRGVDVPIGGDPSTPFQTAFVPHQPYAATAWAPSYRQIIDFADLARSVAVHPGGQSGHPGSRHYLDLFPLWYRGEYHPMLFRPDAIRAHAEHTLRLEP